MINATIEGVNTDKMAKFVFSKLYATKQISELRASAAAEKMMISLFNLFPVDCTSCLYLNSFDEARKELVTNSFGHCFLQPGHFPGLFIPNRFIAMNNLLNL